MAAKSSGKRAATPGKVSMQEVALQAGLSRSAVSLALSGHPSIPAATRDRVIAAARRLGYRKNPLVAALMSVRRSPIAGPTPKTSLAFLTSHLPSDPWRQAGPIRRFHAAARARASELGFRLDEFSLGGTLRPERLAALLRARGIHGLLVAPLPGDQTQLEFDVADFATVGLGLSVKAPSIDRVADDHFFAAQLAFERCLALGYRRIGLALAGNISRRLEHRWWSGFLVAQQQMPAEGRIPALMPETRDAIPPLLAGWIAQHEVDVVIFSLREEARMACAPAATGLVSLSVQDASGRVAGIRQNERLIGAEAIELLAAKLHRWNTGASASPRMHLIRSEWHDGLSAPGAGRKRLTLLDGLR